MTQLKTLSDFEKCRSVFSAVCEGVDCTLTYSELELLRTTDLKTKLRRVRGDRWCFEWTDKLHEDATATKSQRATIIERAVEDGTP